MDVKELQGYIEAAEKRANKKIEDTEARCTKTIGNVNKCVKDLKKDIADLDKERLTCTAVKELGTTQTKLDDHLLRHGEVKNSKRFAFSKIYIVGFLFFAFVGMVISIITLIITMNKTGV